MKIFLLDPEEYAPHVFLLLLPVVITILAYLQHMLLALLPYVSVCLAYIRHLHPLCRSRHQRHHPIPTQKTPFL